MANITITKSEYDELVKAKVKFDLITSVVGDPKAKYINDDTIRAICGVRKGEENGKESGYRRVTCQGEDDQKVFRQYL